MRSDVRFSTFFPCAILTTNMCPYSYHYRFKTQVNLQRHKEYHAGERFSCKTCGRVYPSNSTLKQHEISHSNFRPHKCNICMKTFKRSQDLKFHMNQHTGEKPYRCPYCPKACKCQPRSQWKVTAFLICFMLLSFAVASSGNCFSHRKHVHSDKSIAPNAAANNKRLNAIDKKLVKAWETEKIVETERRSKNAILHNFITNLSRSCFLKEKKVIRDHRTDDSDAWNWNHSNFCDISLTYVANNEVRYIGGNLLI